MKSFLNKSISKTRNSKSKESLSMWARPNPGRVKVISIFKEGLWRKYIIHKGWGYNVHMIERWVCNKEMAMSVLHCSGYMSATCHRCIPVGLFWLFSVSSSTQQWPWEAGLNGLHLWVPLLSRYPLELVNRENSQEIRGRDESEFELLILPTLPHAGCPQSGP